MKIIFFFCCLLPILLSSCQTTTQAGGPDTAPASSRIQSRENMYTGKEEKVINPFLIISKRASYHLIAWFTGHHEFASGEAFVYDHNNVQVILTRHDDSQIEYVNYATGSDADTAVGRERYQAKIDFAISSDGKDATLRLSLKERSFLEMTYLGHSAPDARFGGITDVGTHALDDGFPVLHRTASSVGREGTLVRLGGKQYPVPRDDDISRPPFFTAVRSYLSRNCQSFILPTHTGIQTDCYADGETAIQGGIITMEENGVTEITIIKAVPTPRGSEYTPPELRFDPPLPNLFALKEGVTVSSRFSLHFNGEKNAAAGGTVVVSRKNACVRLFLRPETPKWARKTRRMRYDLDMRDRGFKVQARMEQNLP